MVVFVCLLLSDESNLKLVYVHPKYLYLALKSLISLSVLTIESGDAV